MPWRRKGQPIPVFLPGKSRGQRSLVTVPGVTKSRTRLSDFTFTFTLVAQMVKNLPAVQETQLQSLGWEGSLEKRMATHSSKFLPGELHG